MSNTNNNGSVQGCILLMMVVTAIIMIVNDFSFGIVCLVLAIMFVILLLSIAAPFNSGTTNDLHKPNDSDDPLIGFEKDGNDNVEAAETDDLNYEKIFYDYLDDDNDDDESDEFDESDEDLTDYDVMVNAQEYQKVKTAIKRLLVLIRRMSSDNEMKQRVINHSRNQEIKQGGITNHQFYIFLNKLLGKDIVYLYEHLGYNPVMDISTAEGQLLLLLLQCLSGQNDTNSYSDFKHVIHNSDDISDEIRDTLEEMFDMYKNQTDANITAEGVDEFSLVMVIKCAKREELYLEKARNALYQLADSVTDAAVKTNKANVFLDVMIQRANDDKTEGAASTDDMNNSIAMAKIKDLNSLVGLTQVKKEIMAMKNFIEVNRRREEAGLKAPQVSYHYVFTGNPGTGKTTVARILAGIYKDMGILKKGQLVETDRSGLVAEYVGQTAVKTNKIIDSALDGVLFIDEAYALLNETREDFGKEAIATLVKRMEDNRDRLVVILAGYEAEMQQFIDSNPGLRSRFNRYIHFEDYAADELKQIYLGMLKEYDYILPDEGEQVLLEHFERCVASKEKDFGNARYVRNLFERTIKAQAVRLSAQQDNDKPQLETITAEDITVAIADNP